MSACPHGMIYELLFVRYCRRRLCSPSLFVPGIRLVALCVVAALAGSLVYWLVAVTQAGATAVITSRRLRYILPQILPLLRFIERSCR